VIGDGAGGLAEDGRRTPEAPRDGVGGPTRLRSVRTPIALHGRRLRIHHVEPLGGPPGLPVLLIHGMASSWRQWRGTLLRLGGELALQAVDLPGFGLSELSRRPMAACDYADALEAWCRARGLGAVAAIGHSFGGAVLVDWAARYPLRFRSLGLIAPAAVFHEWYTAGLGLLRTPVLGPLLVPLFIWAVSTVTLGRHVFRHIVADIDRLTPEEMRDLQWGCRRAREMRRALDYYRFPTLEEDLRRIRQPVLVGWGTVDRVVPYSDAEVYMRNLPDARLVTWEGCGHVPMMERPADSDALIREVARLASALPLPH
jgi:pimeloyl-ACP methyl ester carboxylesterase